MARIDARELFYRQDVGGNIESLTTQLDGHVHAKKPELRHPLDVFPGKAAFGITSSRDRCDLGFCELPHLLPEGLVLFVQVDIHAPCDSGKRNKLPAAGRGRKGPTRCPAS